MIRDRVEEQLRSEYGQDGLVFPAYDSYCFGSVPDTVRRVLDAGGRDGLPGDVFEGVETDVDRVVVVLVDGYGLDSWRREWTGSIESEASRGRCSVWGEQATRTSPRAGVSHWRTGTRRQSAHGRGWSRPGT